MTEDNGKKDQGCDCGCGRGGRKWIWLGLAVAILVILFLKNPRPCGCASSMPPEKTVQSTSGQAISTGTSAQPTSAGANEIKKALPSLVDLGAKTCIPCKMMAPILEDLKKTYARKLDVQFIDVSENPDAGKKYGINLIPTQIFFAADGKELFRHEGYFAKEKILAKWKELGLDLMNAPE